MKRIRLQKKNRLNPNKTIAQLQTHMIALEETLQQERQHLLSSQRDVHRLQVLGEIKQSVLVDQSPYQFTVNTFSYLQTLIPYDHASVILFDFEHNKGRVLATHGPKDFNIQENNDFPLDDCFANMDAHIGGYTIIDQASLSPQPPSMLESMFYSSGAQSYLSLLLISNNEVIGSLNIASSTAGAYDNALINIARDIADSLAVAIQKARLLEQSRNTASEFESMTKLATELRRAESYNEILYILIGETMHVSKASAAGFFWIEDDAIQCLCSHHDSITVIEENKQPASARLLQKLLKEDRPQFSYTESKSLLSALPMPDTPGAAVLISLKTVGVLVGKLFLAFDHKQEFSQDDRRLLISMVDFTGNALYRAKILDTMEQRVQNRTQDLSTLYNIANIISQEMSLPATFEQCLSITQHAFRASAGVIHLWHAEKGELEIQVTDGFQQDEPGASFPLYRQVLQEDRPMLVNDLAPLQKSVPKPSDARKFHAFLGAPIRGQKGILGVISLFTGQNGAFNFESLSLLTSVADHISIAIENARLRQRAEDAIVIEERQRMARELHDSVSQLLYSQLLFANASQKAFENHELGLLPGYLNRLAEVSDQAFKEMRLMIYSLRPKVLESVGLVGALQQRLNTVEKRAGLEIVLAADDGTKLPPNVEDGLFRIAQEALNNTLKHAAANRITIKLKRDAECISLEVIDDGVGFDRDQVIEGIGLSSMQERARQLGGKFLIDTQPGSGTRVRVCVELPD